MNTPREMSSKLVHFARLESADRRLLMRAVVWLAVARAMLLVMPFRRLSGQLASQRVRDNSGSNPDPKLLPRISRAVAIAASHVPWRSDCFPQAIAARKLLERYGYASTIHIGVAKNEGEGLAAHAWLTSGDTVVTGGANLERYTELYRLPAK